MNEIPDPIALTTRDLRDARLFADRHDLARGVFNKADANIAEIGVALGDFSRFLIESFAPASFHAFDTFQMHLWPEHWGRTSLEIFGDASHEQFYRNQFEHSPTRVEIYEGMSGDTLREYGGPRFDLIYIDAAHHYEGVKQDAELSVELLTDDGVMIFNDYTLYDPMIRAPYGVVQAVNELVRSGGWVVVGLGLQRHMFCDIAIARR